MNCEWTRDNIVLYIYEELPDDAKFALERHIQHCVTCRKEVEAAREFKDNMSALPAQEVSPNFLTSSRMELQEALEQAQQSRTWGRFVFDFAGWMHQIKLAPALTAALLIIGFAGGTITTYQVTSQARIKDPTSTAQPLSQLNIGAITSVVPQSDPNRVQITYDVVRPQTMVGDLNNPDIQQLLQLACRNTGNADVRLGCFDMMNRLTKQQPEDKEVREALIYALRYDSNPGVRLKALGGLRGYVKDDVHVRDAVLEALMHDTNAGVRAEAIGMLDPVKADSSVRDTLLVLAERDQNKYIRSESKRILGSTPNLD
ncbi:MAG TPA: HEAT repeat domain-containing protein [Candidatus Angelobacter sp.]|nr:HEAT repeat domain-containing protein [Candidatus Angelobacter sp.]